MLELWYRFVELTLPFDWAHYAFMKNALLALLLVTPVFALIGTMVVSNRMAFFSDVLGHSALTGIALGVLLGVRDPLWSMISFMVILSVLISLFKESTRASFDTVLGVFFGAVVALGIVILSRGGGFAKFTSYLIGDILAISPSEMTGLAILFLAVVGYWIFWGNKLVLISVSPILAHSRRMAAFWIQTSFVMLLAAVVAFSIQLVGILMINSLLILPAAAARNLAHDIRSYTFWAIAFSLLSGVAGLLTSYYADTACGATVVLFAALCYVLSAAVHFSRRR
jgi:zinc transport system permease protein